MEEQTQGVNTADGDIVTDDTTASVAPAEEKPVVEDSQPDSEVEQTPEETSSEEAKTVPYDRFHQVNEERKKYKELLEVQDTQPAQPEQTASADTSADDYDDALNLVDKRIDKKMSRLESQIELDQTIRDNPDFYQHSDAIKNLIQSNPSLSWNQAYRLVKYDTLQSQATQKKAEVKATVAKQAAQVEGASHQKAPTKDGGEIDIMAKGPDGKYLYSLEEISKVLPARNE